MDRHQFSTSIRNVWSFLDGITLGEHFATPDPLAVDPAFRDMALSGNATHVELYRYCLSNSHYNMLLFDHSFFQFGWESTESLRLAYFPNPFVSRIESVQSFRRYRSLVAARSLDEDDFSRIAEGMDLEGGVPIFRYEYAPAQYTALAHPASHLHIGTHAENRWAVSRVLTPLAFAMLLSKHYFPAEWALGVDGLKDGEINLHERRLIEERGNCRIIAPEFFGDDERQSFCLG